VIFLNLDGSLINFNFLPMLWASLNTRGIHLICGGKNLDNTHIGSLSKPICPNVWHTTLEMRDYIYIYIYRMNSEAFNNLVLKLAPFLQSS